MTNETDTADRSVTDNPPPVLEQDITNRFLIYSRNLTGVQSAKSMALLTKHERGHTLKSLIEHTGAGNLLAQ